MSAMGPPNKPPYPLNNWSTPLVTPEQAYARGVADERARVVAKLEALHAESLTLPLPQDYVDGIECAVDHLKEET